MESVKVHSPFCYSLTAFSSFSMPQYPPCSESWGERWQSKGQHRQHQEARNARKAGRYCFILLLQLLISMLKGSMWAEILYFAFYTENMGTLLHLSLKGNGTVQFQSDSIKLQPLSQPTTGKQELLKDSAFNYNLPTTLDYLSGKVGPVDFLLLDYLLLFQRMLIKITLKWHEVPEGTFSFSVASTKLSLLLLLLFFTLNSSFDALLCFPTFPHLSSAEFIISCK